MNVPSRKRLQASSNPYKKYKSTALPAPNNPVTGSSAEDQSEKMMEMLRKSEEKYRVIFETANEGIWVTDAERKTILVNQRMAVMLGTTSDEMIGKTPSEYLAPGQEQVRDKIREDLKSGKKIHQEFKFRRMDGSDLWVVSHATPVFDSKGKLQQTTSLLTDITERKEAEEALLQAEAEAQQRAEEFQAILEIAPVAVWIAHDPLCLNITGNRYADEIMQVRQWANISASARSGEAAVTYKVLRNGAEEMKPEELPAQVAAATGKPVAAEMLDLVFSGGRVAHMFMGATPLFDTKGRVRGSVAAGLDISPLKKAEDELRQSKERYRLLVLHAPAGIYEVDFPSGRFTEVNDVMCTILGYTREELLAMRAFDVLDDEGKARFAARIGRAQSGDQPEEAVEYRVRTRDGRLIWALLNTKFRTKDGKFVGATVVAHDISERKRTEEEIRLRAEELLAANQELERFNRAMVYRELQMISLKKQVNLLCTKLNEPKQYELGFEDDDDTKRL